MRKLRCKHCGETAGIQDARSNWRPLGRRNGRSLYACDCGHGLFVGLFGTTYASLEEVGDQRLQMRKAGIDPDRRLPTSGDIAKAMQEAPPGDTHFAVGDRVINPIGNRGTVKDIITEKGETILQVLYDTGYAGRVVSVAPIAGKIRRIEQDR